MGIFDKITKWLNKKPETKTELGVSFEIKGSNFSPYPQKSKATLIQPDPVCPYCGFKYEVFPKDKKPCPSCGEVVIIKSRDKIKHLLTKTQAQKWEDDKREQTKINKAKTYLNMGRIDPDKLKLPPKGTIDEYDLELSSYEKVAFKMLINASLKRTVKKDYNGAFWAYFALTHLLRDAGLDYFKTLQLTHEMKLREMKTEDQHDKDYGWKVKITTNCNCDACKPLDGKILTLDEALETIPFPSKDCTANFPFNGGGYSWFTGSD